MISFNPRFALLLLIITLLSSAEAVVLPAFRPMAASHRRNIDQRRVRVEAPVLNLPRGDDGSSNHTRATNHKQEKKKLERRFYGDFNNPVQRVAGAIIGDVVLYSVHSNPLLDVFVKVDDRQQKHFLAPRRENTNGLASSRQDTRSSASPGPQKRSEGGVPGVIDIMSQDGDSQTRVASLFLEVDDSNETPTYAFGASDTNSTQLLLVPDVESPGDKESVVSLQIPMFDRRTASEVYYCITYDPNPPKPEPFGLTECTNGTTLGDHSSQTFAYSGESGIIEPMWFNQTSSENSSSIASRGNSQAMVLKFQPLEPTAPSKLDAQSIEPAEDGSGTVTTTTTSTMTVTMTGSVDATASQTSSESSPTTSSSSRFGALAVEFVSSSSSTPSSAISSATLTSSTAASTASVDAEAMAESIAASDPASTATSSSTATAAATTETSSSTDSVKSSDPTPTA